MTAVAFVPPNVLPPPLQRFAGLLKRKWFRELVLAPPTISRRRFSNKTEDYGVFQPSLVKSIGQLSALFVTAKPLLVNRLFVTSATDCVSPRAA